MKLIGSQKILYLALVGMMGLVGYTVVNPRIEIVQLPSTDGVVASVSSPVVVGSSFLPPAGSLAGEISRRIRGVAYDPAPGPALAIATMPPPPLAVITSVPSAPELIAPAVLQSAVADTTTLAAASTAADTIVTAPPAVVTEPAAVVTTAADTTTAKPTSQQTPKVTAEAVVEDPFAEAAAESETKSSDVVQVTTRAGPTVSVDPALAAKFKGIEILVEMGIPIPTLAFTYDVGLNSHANTIVAWPSQANFKSLRASRRALSLSNSIATSFCHGVALGRSESVGEPHHLQPSCRCTASAEPCQGWPRDQQPPLTRELAAHSLSSPNRARTPTDIFIVAHCAPRVVTGL